MNPAVLVERAVYVNSTGHYRLDAVEATHVTVTRVRHTSGKSFRPDTYRMTRIAFEHWCVRDGVQILEAS